ncbi:hypothetical protein [Paenibacillus lemnae]|uniref:Uncharacterized protein n=1 Tax=Paenibacillus lemnae TaxID=1330551 RepID=A0A848M205_PAELE|nr:hypothetical protein [Paenibacillus lemnae]NMO94596.1 hypothetical protein [Paenibacillus lemnae]
MVQAKLKVRPAVGHREFQLVPWGVCNLVVKNEAVYEFFYFLFYPFVMLYTEVPELQYLYGSRPVWTSSDYGLIFLLNDSIVSLPFHGTYISYRGSSVFDWVIHPNV